jgi:hypothetical protein
MMRPPPPTPCRHLPAISVAALCARAQTREPHVKNARADIMATLCPNAVIEANMG